ncbi:MAG TPA: hypothetical protein VM597_28760 [Gemmataceae bacterium]|nr:hypothetical protein [Gemmataceae bacterium]
MRQLLGGVALAAPRRQEKSEGGKLKSEPVDVTGKVTAGGAPLGNVQIVFQPTGSDLSVQTPAAVGADGTFQVRLIPGKYVYYFQAREVLKPADRGAFAAGFQKVPEPYRTADKNHTVEAKAGEVVIDVK